MRHSFHGTLRLNCTDAFGASGVSYCWNTPVSGVVIRLQLTRSFIARSCSVETAAISAAVDRRWVRSIQASACGASRVWVLVFRTLPLISTSSPGFGATGPNESMLTWTTGSATGAATVGDVPRVAAVAAISRPAAAAAESLSRRLNTPSP